MENLLNQPDTYDIKVSLAFSAQLLNSTYSTGTAKVAHYPASGYQNS